MAQNEEKTTTKESFLGLQNRKVLTLSGVEKVISINPTQAKIELFGSVLFIFGKEMKMKQLNLEEGKIVIDGEFDAFRYGDAKEKGGFFKRIFK